MAAFREYSDCDGLALARLVKNGDVTAMEVLEAAWEAIDRLNPDLNAITASMRELAERDIAAGLPDGTFRGVPIVLKDEYLFYDGFPCGYAARLGKNTRADYTSTLLRRYLKAGLVITAKANLPEFGASVTTEPVATGRTNNPWNLDRTAGGSSGGSCAAVAAGMVPVAYANDGAGSIRIPASCCGLFGLKPSRGRVPTGPVDGEYWNGLVVQHAVSRSVRDSAALLDASAGWEPGSLYSAPEKQCAYIDEVGTAPGRLRIGMTTEAPTGVPVDPECVAAVERAAGLCSELGHEVVKAVPDYDAPAMASGIADLLSIHLAYGIDGLAAHHGRTPSADIIEASHFALAERGRALGAQRMLAILELFGSTARRAASFFETFDIWLAPTLARPPVKHGDISANDPDPDRYIQRYFDFIPFTPLANVTGNPAMSVPLYRTAGGLPVGIHFMADFGQEAMLFRLAGQLETACPWRDAHPPHGIWNDVSDAAAVAMPVPSACHGGVVPTHTRHLPALIRAGSIEAAA